MLLLDSQAFAGNWDTIEDYISGEVFPQIRYPKAVQEFVKPLVKKRDAKGRPNPAELLEKTIMQEVNKGMRAALGIPEDYDLAHFGIMGYPKEEVEVTFPKLADVSFANRWGISWTQSD